MLFLFQNPFSMVAFSMALAAVGFAIGKTATLMTAWSAGKSLQPPEDLGKFHNYIHFRNLLNKWTIYLTHSMPSMDLNFKYFWSTLSYSEQFYNNLIIICPLPSLYVYDFDSPSWEIVLMYNG